MAAGMQGSGPDRQHQQRAEPSWRALAALMLDPARVLTRSFDGFGPWRALVVSGAAFLLVSLQAALDLHRIDRAADAAMAAILLRGLLIGTLGVAALALFAWAASRLLVRDGARSAAWAVRAFALGYAPALIYGVFGLALNLGFGWNTAVSCGIAGLLWALGPLFTSIREMGAGRPLLAAGLSTACGGFLLYAWVGFGVGA